MRRTRASAQLVVGIGLLVVLLASILAVGPASAATPAGGDTPMQCSQGSGRPPPPVCRVSVDLNDNRALSGSVSAANAVEYVIKGRAGDQFSLEVLDVGNEFCFVFPGLDLTFSDSSGQVIETTSLFGCGTAGPWTIPSGGSMIVRVQTTGDPVAYRLVFGSVAFEDVPVRLRSGAARLTGTVPVALDGVDYVVTAPPGDQVVLEFPTSQCDAPTIAQSAKVLDSAENDLGFLFPGCFNVGPWTVPADGVVKIRIQALSWQGPGSTVGRYDLTVRVLHYRQVVVPAGSETVEVAGSITRPLDGVDYKLASTDVDRVALNLLGDSAGGCDFGTPVLQLSYAIVIDGVVGGFVPLNCGLNNGAADVPASSSVTIRVVGLSRFEQTPTVGSFRLVIGQLDIDRFSVDVRNGPVPTAGNLSSDYDEIQYTVNATPGRLVGAYIPTTGGTPPPCFDMTLLESLFDPSVPIFRISCSPYGPFRVPSTGVVSFNAVTGPFRPPGPGPVNLVLTEFDYEQVPVDLGTGSNTMVGRVDVPLDGTDYVVTGRPGERVQLTFDSLDAPASCVEPQNLPLVVQVFTSFVLTNDRWDVAESGCIGMPPVTIGLDGKLKFRVLLAGNGSVTSGRYLVTLTKLA